MSTCNIKIYRTQLTPSRNALVDKLERYLDNLTPIYSNPSFQYQQLGLDLTIKVNVTQSKITESSIGNYVRIEQDGRVWYYFILGAEWKGKKVVQLALSIDSINTFRNDLHWTDKTTIVRQHGDRFFKQYNNEFIRRIDPEGEGIVAEKYRSSLTNVIDENIANTLRWYLIYRTRDSLAPEDLSDPIACYLCADQQLPIRPESATTVELGAEELVAGNYYYFNHIDNPNGRVTISGNTYQLGQTYQVCTSFNQGGYTYADRILRGVVLYKQSGKIHWAFQWDNVVTMFSNGGDPFSSQISVLTAPGKLNTSGKIDPIRALRDDLPFNYYDPVDSITVVLGELWRYGPTLFWVAEQSLVYIDSIYYTVAGQEALYLNSIDSIDRTDSRLMKILELPYSPCEVIFLNNVYTFPEEWKFEGGMMRLTQFNKGFSNYVGRISLSQLDPGAIIPDHSHDIEAPQDQRDNRRESKLFHSDYYTYKAVYDSFAKEIQLEKIKPFLEHGVYGDNEVYIPVYFKPTNTINSKMAFKFDTQHLTSCADFARYEQNEDYGDYLLISRNNELPIYSNDYVNYIRTGYNYDLKAQELAKKQAIANMAAQAAQAAIGFAAGRYTSTAKAIAGVQPEIDRINKTTTDWQDKYGVPSSSIMGKLVNETAREYTNTIKNNAIRQANANNPYLFTQAVSQASGLIPALVNLHYSQTQATSEREAKMATLAAQSTSVAGSDDIDLLNWYNGNKLQLSSYDTKAYQKEAIANLFHYCGYNHPHMEYPDITSRLWFNFIQCEPFFREEAYTPFQQYLEDIKARYATGVTVYHCNDGQWDWDQEYENWEVLVYPEQSYISNDSVQGFKCTELTGGRYRITFDYLGRQYLNGAASGDENFVVVEMINMFDEVLFTRQIAATTGQHITITTGDFYEAPTKLRYKITYQDKETEWQTIVLAGG